MKAQFLCSDYEQLLYNQYQNCRQRNLSVRDYTEEIYRLNACNNLQETKP